MTLKDIFIKETIARNYSKLERITIELLETDNRKTSQKVFTDFKKARETEHRLTDAGLLIYDVGKEQMQFFVDSKKYSKEIQERIYALPYKLEVVIRNEHGEENENTKK